MEQQSDYVTRDDCGRTSARIFESLDSIKGTLGEINARVGKHEGWHNGTRVAEEMATTRAGLWSKWGMLIISLSVAVGGAVAYLAVGG